MPTWGQILEQLQNHIPGRLPKVAAIPPKRWWQYNLLDNHERTKHAHNESPSTAPRKRKNVAAQSANTEMGFPSPTYLSLVRVRKHAHMLGQKQRCCFAKLPKHSLRGVHGDERRRLSAIPQCEPNQRGRRRAPILTPCVMLREPNVLCALRYRTRESILRHTFVLNALSSAGDR